MDFQQYELLIDLAETRNITNTAKRLGYTQPGASHILKKIETELGFSVIFREKYGVTLTPAAELLLPQIRKIMAEQERLQQTISSINGLEYGKVTIGAYSSVAIHLLPEILHEFKHIHPNLDIDIREGGADRILEWMDKNLVDCAFISRPYAKKLDFMSYGKDPLLAALPGNFCWDEEKTFRIENFEGLPFVLSADGNDFDIHNALESSGVIPDYSYSVLDDQTIMSMVEHKLGVSIVTKLIAMDNRYDIKLIPIEPEYCRDMGIAMVSYDNLTKAARTFVDFSIQLLPQMWEKVVGQEK